MSATLDSQLVHVAPFAGLLFPEVLMPSTVSSARPDALARFASLSSESSVAVSSALPALVSAGQRCRATCRFGDPILNDGNRLANLLRHAHELDDWVRTVAEEFRLADLGSFVDGLISSAMATYNAAYNACIQIPKLDPRWKLLRFDPAGDGRMIEVRGDLATAKHILIYVPGMSNDMWSFTNNLRPRADILYDQMVAEAGNASDVAVITWLGYDTPDLDVGGFVEAAGSAPAKDGAKQLVADINDLRSNGVTGQITVVGHSYGSVVAGRAMRSGLDVDNVIVLGSPGMDAKNRQQLGSPKVNLYASATGRATTKTQQATDFARDVVINGVAPVIPVILVRPIGEVVTGGDYVAQAPVHGPDPTKPGFGAKVFPSNGSGHGAYFDEGSEGVENIAKIAVGKPPARVK